MFVSRQVLKLSQLRAFTHKRLILFGTGKDRSGIITDVSGLIRDQDGNIEESQMSKIGGNFCMMMQVSIPTQKEQEFKDLVEQKQLELNLRLYCNETFPDVDTQGVEIYEAKLQISGADNPGIVSSFTNRLGQFGISFKNAKSYTYAGPWGGSTMFDLVADVLVPLNVDLEKVRSELDAQADEYNAEFSIEKVD